MVFLTTQVKSSEGGVTLYTSFEQMAFLRKGQFQHHKLYTLVLFFVGSLPRGEDLHVKRYSLLGSMRGSQLCFRLTYKKGNIEAVLRYDEVGHIEVSEAAISRK